MAECSTILPNCREELKFWALRKLGYPVIKINVDDEQLEDLLCEALEYYQNYHFDGSEKVYYKHRITASTLTFDVALTGTFNTGEKIIGQTSGAEARFLEQSADNLSIGFRTDNGTTLAETFQVGEVVEGEVSGIQGTIATDGVILGDLDNRYIALPDNVLTVSNIFPFSTSLSGDFHMFDYRYQFALQNMHDLTSAFGDGYSLVEYTNVQRHFELLEQLFVGFQGIRFNRATGKVHLDINWDDVEVGQYFVFDGYAVLSPSEYPKIYKDRWLREYTTALFKKQWAMNLRKYQGIELPGGVTLNAESILEEAKVEITELRERIEKEFQLPVDFIVG